MNFLFDFLVCWFPSLFRTVFPCIGTNDIVLKQIKHNSQIIKNAVQREIEALLDKRQPMTQFWKCFSFVIFTKRSNFNVVCLLQLKINSNNNNNI